ncbi:MAG TPA: ABC transporter substrate-binding protein, partial [Bradyrhizobium sp.]
DDPHTFSWVYDSNIVRQVCGYLTRTGVDNITRPDLAAKWEASSDLKTWTFTIADRKWHDGRDFTAEDAAWNIRRCLADETGSSVQGLMKGYMLTEVDTGKKDDKGNPVKANQIWRADAIEAKDPKTLVLHLKEPNVGLPEHLFHYPLLMLDPKENGKFGVGSNGTGAFTLTAVEVGRKAVLKAVPGRGAHLDGMDIVDFGDNPAANAAALQSKQVDGIYQGNAEQLDLYKAMPHVTIYDVVTADTGVARMRSDPPFDDARVRKALRLATDPAKTLAIAQKGFGTPAEHHHVSPVHPDYFKLPMMTRDVAAAKKLLAEAGHPDGIDVEIACKSDPSWEETAVQAMVEQWKDAGIRCKINVLPSAKYWDIWTTVPFGFTNWSHRPLGFMVLALAYRTGVPWNEAGYSNPKFDAILTKAEGTLDVEARAELVGQLETIMQEDGPIVQPLWRNIFAAYDKKVQGFTMHPTAYIFAEMLAMSKA